MASSVTLSSSGTMFRRPFRFPGRPLQCARLPRRCRVAATAVGGTSLRSDEAAEGVGEVGISLDGVRNGAAAAAAAGTTVRVEVAEERDEDGVGLSVLYDDGFGKASVKDYLDWSREMIRADGGGPRWFCPLECGAPLKDSPLLLFLPGTDGTGLGLILHHKALGKRDSFITYRAFSDALAQDSGRLPITALNAMGSHLYDCGSNMGLDLSQVSSQLSSLQDQSTPPPDDLIRLDGCRSTAGAGEQFDRLIPHSNASSFRLSPADASSSPFFLGAGINLEFQDSQSHQHLLQNKPFHGLMQLPDLQNRTAPSSSTASTASTATAANLFNFNLGFFPNGSGANAGNIGNSINGHLLIHDQFNNSIAGGAADKPPAGLFLGNVMSDPMDPGVSPLYVASVHKSERAMLPQMSATALLQKAA